MPNFAPTFIHINKSHYYNDTISSIEFELNQSNTFSLITCDGFSKWLPNSYIVSLVIVIGVPNIGLLLADDVDDCT